MNTYSVTYFVQNAGTVTETITAASEYNVRRLIEAKYPNIYVRVIQVNPHVVDGLSPSRTPSLLTSSRSSMVPLVLRLSQFADGFHLIWGPEPCLNGPAFQHFFNFWNNQFCHWNLQFPLIPDLLENRQVVAIKDGIAG